GDGFHPCPPCGLSAPVTSNDFKITLDCRVYPDDQGLEDAGGPYIFGQLFQLGFVHAEYFWFWVLMQFGEGNIQYLEFLCPAGIFGGPARQGADNRGCLGVHLLPEIVSGQTTLKIKVLAHGAYPSLAISS